MAFNVLLPSHDKLTTNAPNREGRLAVGAYINAPSPYTTDEASCGCGGGPV